MTVADGGRGMDMRWTRTIRQSLAVVVAASLGGGCAPGPGTAVSDMAMPDLATRDLALPWWGPDFAMPPDLRQPDFAVRPVRDLTAPDLADPLCGNGVMNGTETDVDCGGLTCPQCRLGARCAVDGDCRSGACANGACAPCGLGLPPRRTVLGTGAFARSVALADLDGDGANDLVTANESGRSVSVLMGQGGGRFAPAVDYAAGAGPRDIALGDLDGDTRPDVAVVNYD